MILQTLEMTLKTPRGEWLPPSVGSILQGIIMQNMDSGLADELHKQGLRPYSQHIFYRNGEPIWRINALDGVAAEGIIEPLCAAEMDSIYLQAKNMRVEIIKKDILRDMKYQELANKFLLLDNAPRNVVVQLITPTTFRSAGNYMIYPTVEHILQSAYNRWNEFAVGIPLRDPDILRHMAEHTRIKGYKLKMTQFSLEGIQIPAFKGELELRISGPDALVGLELMVLAFAEVSGIGIKTAIGMGGCRTFYKTKEKELVGLLD